MNLSALKRRITFLPPLTYFLPLSELSKSIASFNLSTILFIFFLFLAKKKFTGKSGPKANKICSVFYFLFLFILKHFQNLSFIQAKTIRKI